MDKKEKKIAEKMHDYRRFAITLLCVGSFFYLGTILPIAGKTMFYTNGYILTSVLFLTASVVCFLQSSKYKKQLLESDQIDS